MSNERSLWRTLLQVEPPWSVLDSQLDQNRKRYDVWIGLEEPRGWFGLGRARQVQAATASWRHVGLGDWEIHVHVATPSTTDLSRAPWAGDDSLPFTHALNRQIFRLLREGCSLQSVCTLLDLPIADLWRFQHAMDSGRWGATEFDTAVDVGNTSSPTAYARPPSDPEIPDPTDPVWLTLVEECNPIDVRVLGLKMLLARTRTQFERISDDEVRQMKLNELHRYFIRNKRLLTHELAQIRKLTT